MIGSFQEARIEELPPWLAGPVATALEAALGNDENQALGELEDVLRMYSPFTVPDDGLDALGVRFALPRYPGEPNGTAPPSPGTPGTGYRGRLCDVWDAWLWAGTAKAVQDQLQAFGIPSVVVLTEADNGPIYVGAWYSRALVVLGPNFGTTGIGPSLLGTNTTLGGFLLGSTCTVAQRSAMKRIAWRWKAVHGVIPDLLLVYEAESLGIGTVLGGFTLGGEPCNQCYLQIMPQLGETTFLGTWPLGQVDLT